MGSTSSNMRRAIDVIVLLLLLRCRSRSLASLPRVSLEGTVSIVTGAASGIGRAAVMALAAEGAAVAAVDREPSGLHSLARELEESGATIVPLTVDLADLGGVAGIVDATV